MGRGHNGIGDAVRAAIREYITSREVAEKIQQIVGADRRLAEVRHGTFAGDGVVGDRYLPMGGCPNILPALAAEFEGYFVGQTLDTSIATTDAVVVMQQGFKRLQTLADGSGVSTHDPYLNEEVGNKRWHQYGPVDTTYIYSTHAFKADGQTDINHVGLRIRASADALGTNPTTLVDTPENTTDMWPVSGSDGSHTRLHVKFKVPADKPFLRIQYKVLTKPGGAVNWGNNMLEIVDPSRTTPSKYASPTARGGELSEGQMQFGLGRNVLPTYIAGLASSFNRTSGTAVAADVVLDGTVQGIVRASTVGDGFSFNMSADGTYKKAQRTLVPAPNANSTVPLRAGRRYMFSCEIRNVSATTIDLTMQLRASDTPNSGPWTTLATTAKKLPIGTDTYRLFVSFDYTTNTPAYPAVEFSGVRAVGPSPGQHSEIRIESFMLEDITGLEQLQPSAWANPVVGLNDIRAHQIEPYPLAMAERSTSGNIASGGDQLQPLTVTVNSNMGAQNVANVVKTPKPGYYLVVARAEIAFLSSDTNRLFMKVVQNGSTSGTYIDRQIVNQSVNGNNLLSGASIEKIQTTGDTIGIRIENGGSSSRTINYVQAEIRFLGE